jgi:hypothetical protein
MDELQLSWLRRSGQHTEWLAQVIEHGFQVIPLDGKREHEADSNLALVYGRDVPKLDQYLNPPPREHKSKLCYEMRQTGLKWADIASRARVTMPNAITMARKYSASHGLSWPIPIKS